MELTYSVGRLLTWKSQNLKVIEVKSGNVYCVACGMLLCVLCNVMDVKQNAAEYQMMSPSRIYLSYYDTYVNVAVRHYMFVLCILSVMLWGPQTLL